MLPDEVMRIGHILNDAEREAAMAAYRATHKPRAVAVMEEWVARLHFYARLEWERTEERAAQVARYQAESQARVAMAPRTVDRPTLVARLRGYQAQIAGRDQSRITSTDYAAGGLNMIGLLIQQIEEDTLPGPLPCLYFKPEYTHRCPCKLEERAACPYVDHPFSLDPHYGNTLSASLKAGAEALTQTKDAFTTAVDSALAALSTSPLDDMYRALEHERLAPSPAMQEKE